MNRIEGPNNGVTNNVRESRVGNSRMERVVDDGAGENPYTLMDRILSNPARKTGLSVAAAAAAVFSGLIPGSAVASESAIVIEGEMPSQKGSVLDQLENSVASGKTEAIVGLGTVENEKRPEQIVAGEIVGYLNSETPNTDEEIKSEVFNVSWKKDFDLGLNVNGDIQGRFLGYLETDDKENLLLFIGLKDRKQNRFVTALRLPLYLYEDKSIPHYFLFDKYWGSDLAGSHSTIKVKDTDKIIDGLDPLVGENVILVMDETYSDKAKTKKVLDLYSNNLNLKRFMEEKQEAGIGVARSLLFDSFSNGIRLLDYSDPKKKVFKIKDGIDDEITDILLDLASDDKKVVNVPPLAIMGFK